MEQSFSYRSFCRKYPEIVGNLVLIIETSAIFELTRIMHSSRIQRVRENVTSVRTRLLGLLYDAQIDPKIIESGTTLLKEPFAEVLKIQLKTTNGAEQFLHHWSAMHPPHKSFVDPSLFID